MSRDLVSQNISQNTRKIPPGTIAMWPSNTIPKGWLLCDGDTINQDLYPALFSVIGYTYTSGDYPSLPDLRTLVPYATGSAGTTGGVSTVTLSAAESGLRSHTHTYTDFYADSTFAACSGAAVGSVKSGATAGETSTGVYIVDTSYGSGYPAQAAHTNLQPYLLINFIIKT